MFSKKQFVISMMCFSLAVLLVPALGILNIGIGCIWLGIELWRESD